MNAVIYARYSSFGQREESIEGQLKACYEYARDNGYTVIREYVDRAMSATHAEHRADFQQMVFDSASGSFDTVIVYQFDRFARNRYDSAIYKGKLRQNGVRVVSAKENISDDPAGQMLEGILESLAEYYSNDLSQKVRRGLNINASKAMYNGGTVPWGYKVGEDRRFEIDEDTAPIIKRVFEEYVNGKSIADIAAELNSLGIKTCKGTTFGKSSLQRVMRNKRYKGVYIYGDTEIPGGMPAIISEDLFDAAQKRMRQYKHRRGVTGDYLLTTKLYCGHCGNMMVGVSGTSRTKITHHYYACKGTFGRECGKKNIRRDFIENLVVNECRKALTSKNISAIAKHVSRLCELETETPYLKQLRKELSQADAAIENLLQALEKGAEADLLIDRIAKKREEKSTIEAQIAKEELAQVKLSESDIVFFLSELKNGNIDDDKYRKMLVNVLVNKIFLYDDKLTIYFNAGKKTVVIEKDFKESDSSPGQKPASGSNKAHGSPPPNCKASHQGSFFCGRGIARGCFT